MKRRSQTSDAHSGAVTSFIGDGTRNRFALLANAKPIPDSGLRPAPE